MMNKFFNDNLKHCVRNWNGARKQKKHHARAIAEFYCDIGNIIKSGL